MSLEIRPFAAADAPALSSICLRTGAEGRDATGLYRDPRLLGLYYADPYAAFDPGLCLVAVLDGEVSGYLIGTSDSVAFQEWTERAWFPALRIQYPMPMDNDRSADAALIRKIHDGYAPHPDTAAYPAHLHIDLLPALQGRGVGRALMQRWLDLLRARNCPAVHLGVSAANAGGIAFYEKLGFHLIGDFPGWRAYGMTL